MQMQLELTKPIRNKHYFEVVNKETMWAKVVGILADGAALTNREIARALGTDVCSVVGRTYELRAENVIEWAGRKKCSVTGNSVSAWRLK